MSTRNNMTYKPMVNAGTTLLVMSIFNAAFSMLTIILGFSVSNPILGMVLLFAPSIFSWLTYMLFFIFLYIGFDRMGEIPTSDSERVKKAKISSLIFIILWCLYLIISALDMSSLLITYPAIVYDITLYSISFCHKQS